MILFFSRHHVSFDWFQELPAGAIVPELEQSKLWFFLIPETFPIVFSFLEGLLELLHRLRKPCTESDVREILLPGTVDMEIRDPILAGLVRLRFSFRGSEEVFGFPGLFQETVPAQEICHLGMKGGDRIGILDHETRELETIKYRSLWMGKENERKAKR